MQWCDPAAGVGGESRAGLIVVLVGELVRMRHQCTGSYRLSISSVLVLLLLTRYCRYGSHYSNVFIVALQPYLLFMISNPD